MVLIYPLCVTINNIFQIQEHLLQQLEFENQNFSFEWKEVRNILPFARNDALTGSDSPQGYDGSAPEEAILMKFLKQYRLFLVLKTLLYLCRSIGT